MNSIAANSKGNPNPIGILDNMAKRNFLALMVYLKIFPSIYFVNNPFKIIEFFELKKDIEFSKKDKLLDIGCGFGLQTCCLGRLCDNITGIDPDCTSISSSKILAHYAKIDSEFLCTEVENARFDNESFDKIFCICVLEHIPNYSDTLREIYRILKKDGKFILSVDSLINITSKESILKHKMNHKVIKYFQSTELGTLLKETGFKEINIYPIFKSDYARKLFVDSIDCGFKFGIPSYLFNYLNLKHEESKTNNKEGIFLIAKCTK